MESKNDLNPQLLRLMFNTIRTAEIENVKTQRKDDKGMVKSIEKYVNKKVEEEMLKNED